MLPGYEKKSNLGALGLLLMLLGLFLPLALAGYSGGAAADAVAVATGILIVTGAVLWYYGLGCYAIGKGYSGVLAVLGVFGILGLLVLLALPDKHKAQPADLPPHAQ